MGRRRAVGEDDLLVDLVGVDEGRPVDAERLGLAGRAGGEEAGVVGQRQLDGGRAERPADQCARRGS